MAEPYPSGDEIVEPTGEHLHAPPPPPPSKRLGRAMSMAMVVGTVIGSGIYLLPATTAPFGWNLVFAFALVAIGTLTLAFCLSRLSARLPGGPYSYVAAAFGDTAAFMTMWSYIIAMWSAIAAVSVAIGGALAFVFPVLTGSTGLGAVAFAALAIFAVINWNGARTAGYLQIIATLIKILPLIAVMLLVVTYVVTGTSLQPLASTPISFGSIVGAGALMLFAFTGFEGAAVNANVTDNAQEAVPRATFLGTIFVSVVYVLATISVLLLLPSATAAQSGAPFSDAIAPILGTAAGVLVAIVAAISAFGTGNATVLGAIETLRATANAGDLPPAFARTNKNGVATGALGATTVVSGLLIFTALADSFIEVFTFVALISAVAALVLYLVCSAAALKMRMAPIPVAILAILYAFGMLVGAGLEAVAWGGALMIAGLPIRWLSRKRWPDPPAVTPA